MSDESVKPPSKDLIILNADPDLIEIIQTVRQNPVIFELFRQIIESDETDLTSLLKALRQNPDFLKTILNPDDKQESYKKYDALTDKSDAEKIQFVKDIINKALECGFTPTGLAKEFQVSVSVIWHWKLGLHIASPENIRKIQWFVEKYQDEEMGFQKLERISTSDLINKLESLKKKISLVIGKPCSNGRLAKELQVSPSIITAWYEGKHPISPRNLRKMRKLIKKYDSEDLVVTDNSI
jgi:hypothetical protein